MLLMLYFSRCDEVNICMYIATVIFVCYLKLNAVFHGLAANTVLCCLQGAGESRTKCYVIALCLNTALELYQYKF